MKNALTTEPTTKEAWFTMNIETTTSQFDASKIERPDKALFRYYVFIALLTGPVSPIVLMPLWFRYATLRYKFDEAGVSMRWGILFRREVYLTYRRIQDIHLTRNILQRWMGLAKISLQTASGSSQAEMAIEGVLQAEELRDHLYSQMRGAKGQGSTSEDSSTDEAQHSRDERAHAALQDIRDALQTLVSQKNAGGDAQ